MSKSMTLKMPTAYVELSENEMQYDGGFGFDTLFGPVIRSISNTLSKTFSTTSSIIQKGTSAGDVATISDPTNGMYNNPLNLSRYAVPA